MPEHVVVAPSILLADFARLGAEVAASLETGAGATTAGANVLVAGSAAFSGGIGEAYRPNIEAIRSAALGN